MYVHELKLKLMIDFNDQRLKSAQNVLEATSKFQIHRFCEKYDFRFRQLNYFWPRHLQNFHIRIEFDTAFPSFDTTTISFTQFRTPHVCQKTILHVKRSLTFWDDRFE